MKFWKTISLHSSALQQKTPAHRIDNTVHNFSTFVILLSLENGEVNSIKITYGIIMASRFHI